ncbi:hypothetical protein GALMADRAFT_1246282 [Galerina marginata CBS 339.88]|uniref:Uncharacterized protein n=1 Tax=Galerina marginata (strain CBS 339.88) TaxID=685588 RepID=A0A067T8V9_GALM3|nr:hypothetical protein GALMADRAFT_1246282 [Galerina marginata CBS 339.88]
MYPPFTSLTPSHPLSNRKRMQRDDRRRFRCRRTAHSFHPCPCCTRPIAADGLQTNGRPSRLWQLLPASLTLPPVFLPKLNPAGPSLLVAVQCSTCSFLGYPVHQPRSIFCYLGVSWTSVIGITVGLEGARSTCL